MTDAELIYTPSQIALASLDLASPEIANQWIRYKDAESVLPIMESIKDMITRDSAGPDVEAVREVDKRLRLCKNPEKVPGSKAFMAKKAEEETKAEEKRTKKAGDMKRAVEAGDPFGDELETTGGIDPTLEDDDDD